MVTVSTLGRHVHFQNLIAGKKSNCPVSVHLKNSDEGTDEGSAVVAVVSLHTSQFGELLCLGTPNILHSGINLLA